MRIRPLLIYCTLLTILLAGCSDVSKPLKSFTSAAIEPSNQESASSPPLVSSTPVEPLNSDLPTETTNPPVSMAPTEPSTTNPITDEGIEIIPQNDATMPPDTGDSEEQEQNDRMIPITIQVGSSTFSAKLFDNATTRSLIEQMPMTLHMSELNGNEKYFYMTDNLPTDTESVGSVRTGDLMLYGSACLVLFYDSFSTSYSYTRLGYIEDTADLSTTLGSGSVQVTFDPPMA